jgi:hypothetical protein
MIEDMMALMKTDKELEAIELEDAVPGIHRSEDSIEVWKGI